MTSVLLVCTEGLGAQRGAEIREAGGTSQDSWPSGSLAVSDCQTGLLKRGLFTRRRWNILPSQGQSLMEGSGGRERYLAWNYSRGCTALHSNRRLVDRT